LFLLSLDHSICKWYSFRGEGQFRDLWDELRRSVHIFTICKIKNGLLSEDFVCSILNEYPKLFISDTQIITNNESSTILFKNIIEHAVREYLFISCKLIFGPHYHDRIGGYPETLKRYFSTPINNQVLEYEYYNEFHNLSSKEFRVLLKKEIHNTDFYRYIIKPITNNEGISFFEIISSKMEEIEQFENIERSDLSNELFASACLLMNSLCERIKTLLISKHLVIKDKSKIYVTFGHETSDEYNIPQSIYWHDITESINESRMIISDSITNFNGLKVNINRIEEVTSLFYTEYTKVISSLVYLFKENHIEILFPYGYTLFIKKVQLRDKNY